MPPKLLHSLIIVVGVANIVVATVALARHDDDSADDSRRAVPAHASDHEQSATTPRVPTTVPLGEPDDDVVVDADYVAAHPPPIDIASADAPIAAPLGGDAAGSESMWGPPGTMEAIIRRYFTGPEGDRALEIVQCESQMNPNAISETNDYGLFQINAVHREGFEAVTGAPWDAVFHPEYNTVFAHYLWSEFGWSRWTCDRMV